MSWTAVSLSPPSWTGLVVVLTVLAPNVLLLGFPPRGAPTTPPRPGVMWVGAERVGQVACVGLLVASRPGWASGAGWAWAVGACVTAYLALWIRYLARGRAFALLYAPLGPLPVPMAVLPVVAFGLTALWVGSAWACLAVVVLAAGHLRTAVVVARVTRMHVRARGRWSRPRPTGRT
ncbi:hypothetical protein [Actinotalea subterranea]|uniref:hypothetical protein n=1 Tax=Actinotalea subterranea TaxID=2607497 RepID=UPI0011EFBE8A|nr:hypothetical protein [Actinotalea subterranea]